MRRVRDRWGEPVFKFVACLLQRARDRYYIAGDDDSWLDSKYWVCAYANNQHAYAPFASPCLRSPVRVAEERAPRLGCDVTATTYPCMISSPGAGLRLALAQVLF
jgi:hypothetical protein